MGNPHRMQTYGSRHIEVDLSGLVQGQGRLAPLVKLPLSMRAGDPDQQLRLVNVLAELWCAGELVGDGRLTGQLARNYAMTVFVTIRTSHRLLDWVTDQLGATTAVGLQLHLVGAVQFRESDLDPWQDDELTDTGHHYSIAISRSDWYEHVLKPVQQTDYVYLEIATPAGPTAAAWSKAVGLLRSAEAAYAQGDDDLVFQRVRGCLDSLPGAKKDIFGAVHPEGKRKAIDDLTREFGNYLHTGRHVAAPGSAEEGTFPVNHLDASFAIATMKVLMSYASRIITTSPQN